MAEGEARESCKCEPRRAEGCNNPTVLAHSMATAPHGRHTPRGQGHRARRPSAPAAPWSLSQAPPPRLRAQGGAPGAVERPPGHCSMAAQATEQNIPGRGGKGRGEIWRLRFPGCVGMKYMMAGNCVSPRMKRPSHSAITFSTGPCPMHLFSTSATLFYFSQGRSSERKLPSPSILMCACVVLLLTTL